VGDIVFMLTGFRQAHPLMCGL